MNGVRRLWGGGRTSPATSQPPSQPEPTLTAPPPVPTTASNSKPPWSPQGSPPTSPLATEPPVASTPGLVIRKDKAKLPPIPPSTNFSGETSPPITSPTGSLDSYAITSPNGCSDFPSPSTGLVTSPPAPPITDGIEWKRTSGLVNIRDELLMSLLSSEAIIDSRNCEILSAEEIEELKKVRFFYANLTPN